MVDNSSTDGTAEICDQEMKSWANGRFVPTGGNYGFGGGCNYGARQSRGKYLFFLNPDVLFKSKLPGGIDPSCRILQGQSFFLG